jgi:hypothetical protein
MSAAAPRPGLFRPGFVAVFVAVLAIGIGLPVGVRQLTAAARKEAIDIRVPLQQLRDDALPSFRLRRDLQIDTVGPEWLGTSEMIIVPLEPRDPQIAIAGDSAARLPTLFISYYSDPDETIPHTPEVCYDQAGASIRGVARVPITVAGRDDGPHEAKRIIADRTGTPTRVVLYVLYHNGKVLNDRQQVRRAMAIPGDTRTYFAKIEAVVPVGSTMSEDEAEATARRILEEAIPVVAAEHLPPDAAVRAADGTPE